MVRQRFLFLPLSLAVFIFSLSLNPISAYADTGLGDQANEILDLKPTDVIFWEAVNALVQPNGEVVVGLRLSTKQNFTLYKDKVSFKAPQGFSLKRLVDPPTRPIIDPISNKEVQVYSGGDFELTFAGLEPFKGQTFPLAITFLGCTERICLFPYTLHLDIAAYAADQPAGANSAANGPGAMEASSASSSSNNQASSKGVPSPAINEASSAAPVPATSLALANNSDVASSSSNGGGNSLSDLAQDYAGKLMRGELGIGVLLLVLFIGGLLTNLTPCVAPMIPITARLLAGRGGSAVTHAAMYALGIVVSYATLGIAVMLSGAFFGSILANPIFNLVYAGIFFALALLMLGFGNLAKLQELGSRIGGHSRSPWSTFLMGTGAGLVAAPCTGPILGALLAYTMQSPDRWRSASLFVVYSAGFAFPYLFLGAAFNRLAKTRVAPGVQVFTKLLFAAVIAALGFYFLRVPLYGAVKALRGHWFNLAIVAGLVGVACLLAQLRLARFTQAKSLSVLTAASLGLGLFAFSQNLTGGDRVLSADENLVTWIKSEAEGFAQAKATGKPILIDNWAEWCEACKKMDVGTFGNPVVMEELGRNWTTIKLDLTEINDENDKITAKYGLVGLPTLVLVPADGDISKAERIVGEVSPSKLLQDLEAFKKRK